MALEWEFTQAKKATVAECQLDTVCGCGLG
jgi:hypothetical protein